MSGRGGACRRGRGPGPGRRWVLGEGREGKGREGRSPFPSPRHCPPARPRRQQLRAFVAPRGALGSPSVVQTGLPGRVSHRTLAPEAEKQLCYFFRRHKRGKAERLRCRHRHLRGLASGAVSAAAPLGGSVPSEFSAASKMSRGALGGSGLPRETPAHLRGARGSAVAGRFCGA